MPLPILTAQAQAQCPHAAKATFAATSTKVLIENGPVFVQGDMVTFVGCPFTIPTGKPQPCVKGLVITAAAKVLVEARPAILRSPSDMAQSAEQIPQGPLVYASTQMKVIAT